MRLKKAKIKKILIISLSNIGDIVLTFPVFDILKSDFPEAEISLIVGPKGEGLLKNNPHIHTLYIFNKRQRFAETLKWMWHLRKKHFDLIVDLRNTWIPFLIPTRYKTSFVIQRSRHKHMCWQHLNRLKSIYPYNKQTHNCFALYITESDRQYVRKIIQDKIQGQERFVVIAPGAADVGKRWSQEGYAILSDYLIDTYRVKVILVGDKNDRKIIQGVIKRMKNNAWNLAGQFTLTQLAYLLQQTLLVITNDTAPMHMASYMDVPVLALFGPTDHRRYGPWGTPSQVVERKIECPVCQKQKRAAEHTCMQSITVEDILKTFEIMPDGVKFKN